MCQVLGVSRSGYYLWEKHNKSERQKEKERLIVHIRGAYGRGRGTYGRPRITAELKDNWNSMREESDSSPDEASWDHGKDEEEIQGYQEIQT
jgi:hypothetical protein